MNLKSALVGLALAASFGESAVAAGGGPDPCEYFFRALEAVPSETLTRKAGEHKSISDGKKYAGCEVKLVTSTNLVPDRRVIPDFHAGEGTDLHRDGWRPNESYTADGAGSSSFGIEKGKTLCLIMDHQPAHIDEKEGFIQSEIITIIVQCRNKPE